MINLQLLTSALPEALPTHVAALIQSYAAVETVHEMQRDWDNFLQSKNRQENSSTTNREAEFALIEEFSERQISRFRPFIEDIDRYAEWRPYVENKITLQNGTEVSASPIQFAQPEIQSHHFIASQAPTEKNRHLFWQMVFEQQGDQIVMLTELSEDNEELCYPYWPQNINDKICFENGLVVTLLEHSVLLSELRECIEMRKCCLSQHGTTRIVTHYWYRHWPDFTAPTQTQTIKALVNVVAQDKKSNNSHAPIITHCAAGVGRTSVFVIWYLQRQSAQPLDLFTLTGHLRWQRHEMVGELSQYLFCDQARKD